MFNKYLSILLILFFFTILVSAADKDGARLQKTYSNLSITDDPIVESNWKFHKRGALWSRVTNFGKTGDDAYTDRSPSGDWPGGSGNSYLYRGSLWLTGRVDGEIRSTQPEDSEYAPLDSVHEYLHPAGEPLEYETWTRYYDVKSPLANGHNPLGLEITERTFSWSQSFRDDFIIYELSIKNVGLDSDDDGYPDLENDIGEFYFTYRLDGDVSKLPDWGAEYQFSNQDDIAGVNSNWGILELYPDWQAEAGTFFDEHPADSTMIFMWDGDNPNVPAWDGEGAPEDDAFNPSSRGGFNTPGFLGLKILKTEPDTLRPSSFHVNHIYNDPKTDQEAYERMMLPKEFGDGAYGGSFEYSGTFIHPETGLPFPNDYRAVLSLGPIDTLAYGDSVKVTFALAVGADTAKAGVHSLMKLVENMEWAQFLVDQDYPVITTAPPPSYEILPYRENGINKGVRILWDKSAESNFTFYGYKIKKSTGKDDKGNFDWKEIYSDSTTGAAWPPPDSEDDPSKYEIIDMDIINGLDYYYTIQSVSKHETIGYDETSESVNIQSHIPANQVAQNLDNVKVVPNPYIGSAQWNNPRPSDTAPWKHRLQFTNLPKDATIKIFSLDLDFIAEVKAGESAVISDDFSAEPVYSVAEWNLITRNNQEAAPGIYIYIVDSPSVGQKTGKFVIIR